MAGHQIVPVRDSPVRAADHGQVASVPCNHGRRRQVEGGAQAPCAVMGDHGVVAGMVVQVRHRSVETHPGEQLPQVGFRFAAHAPDLIREQEIRPASAVGNRLVRPQQRQGARHAGAAETRSVPVAVEAADKQHVAVAHGDRAAFRHGQAAGARQGQQAVFDSRRVPAVVRPRQLRDPEIVSVSHHGLGARPADGRSEAQQFLGMAGRGVSPFRSTGNDPVRAPLQVRQIHCRVAPPMRRRWIGERPESECADAVVGTFRQVVELLRNAVQHPALDHEPAPGVRHGVADCAEEAAQTSRLERSVHQAQLHRVDLDGVRAFPVPAAVDELAERYAAPVRYAEPPRGGERGVAGQRDVDEALAFRSHRPAPGGALPVAGRASVRAGRPRGLARGRPHRPCDRGVRAPRARRGRRQSRCRVCPSPDRPPRNGTRRRVSPPGVG